MMAQQKDSVDAILLSRIQTHQQEIEEHLKYCNSDFGMYEGVYRFYYQSFKVYYMQPTIRKTLEIVKDIAGEDFEINEWFLTIANEALDRKFSYEDNKNWLESTRVICEAYFHAYYFLNAFKKACDEMQPETMSQIIDYYWGSILLLFQSR